MPCTDTVMFFYFWRNKKQCFAYNCVIIFYLCFKRYPFHLLCVVMCTLAHRVKISFSETVIFSLLSHRMPSNETNDGIFFTDKKDEKENDFKVNHVSSERACEIWCFFRFLFLHFWAENKNNNDCNSSTNNKNVYIFNAVRHPLLCTCVSFRFVFVFVILFSRCLFCAKEPVFFFFF